MAAAIPSIEKAAAGVKSNAALDILRRPKQLLIGGRWVPSKSGKTFETINPANEEVLALAAEGDKADVDEAVKAARAAYEEGKWPKVGPHQRARYLLKIRRPDRAKRGRIGDAREPQQWDGNWPRARNGRRCRGYLPLLCRMGHQDLRRDQSV
jgi:Aldehyde dehydrogenase family